MRYIERLKILKIVTVLTMNKICLLYSQSPLAKRNYCKKFRVLTDTSKFTVLFT